MAYLPEVGVGVVVLSSGNNPWIARVISSYFLDQMIGYHGAELSERLEQRSVEEKASVAEDKARKIQVHAPAVLALAPGKVMAKAPAFDEPRDLVGRYNHPAYGTLDIQMDPQGHLRVSLVSGTGSALKNIEANLESGILQLADSADMPRLPPIFLKHRAGDKHPNYIFWRLEPEVDPIAFKSDR